MTIENDNLHKKSTNYLQRGRIFQYAEIGSLLVCATSLYEFGSSAYLNHVLDVRSGVLSGCFALLGLGAAQVAKNNFKASERRSEELKKRIGLKRDTTEDTIPFRE